MQSQPPARNPKHGVAKVMARQADEPPSDLALVALLGGIYLGGLTAFVTGAYVLSTLLG